MNLHLIFPTTISESTLDRSFTQEEMDVFLHYLSELKPSEGNNQSVESFVLNNPALSSLKEWIQTKINEHAHEILSMTDVELYITNSWLNINTPGEYHHRHTHYNSILSGVLYIETNPDDRIFFFDSRPNHPLSINRNEINLHNAATWWLPSNRGSMYLFPSQLEHAVSSVHSATQNRISLAFNTFLTGTIGDSSMRTELKF